MKVLLAEDTPANQKQFQYTLEIRGHHLAIAQNGREALRYLEKASFDVIFMDVQMPEMHGYEATRLIRRSPTWLNPRCRSSP